MSQSHTFEETHTEICKTLGLDPSRVHYALCSQRPGHGRIEPLNNQVVFRDTILRFVNETSYLLVLESGCTQGSLHLQDIGIWFKAHMNTKHVDQMIIELDDYEPWVPVR